LKPGASIETAKVPGSNSVNAKRPCSSVLVERFWAVCVFVICTVAEPTADPLESVIDPESCPVNPWPKSEPDQQQASSAISAAAKETLLPAFNILTFN
jgi:hypothetical protein